MFMGLYRCCTQLEYVFPPICDTIMEFRATLLLFALVTVCPENTTFETWAAQRRQLKHRDCGGT